MIHKGTQAASSTSTFSNHQSYLSGAAAGQEGFSSGVAGMGLAYLGLTLTSPFMGFPATVVFIPGLPMTTLDADGPLQSQVTMPEGTVDGKSASLPNNHRPLGARWDARWGVAKQLEAKFRSDLVAAHERVLRERADQRALAKCWR